METVETFGFLGNLARKPWKLLMPQPVKIRVRWSEHKGFLAIQNPVDGKVYFVQAKGLPRWVFNRIEDKEKYPSASIDLDRIDMDQSENGRDD